MFSLVLVFILTCLVYLYDYSKKREYRWKKLCEFPGDTPLPLVGNSLQLGFDADESSHKLLQLWEKHGKQNFRLSIGSEDWIMLSDPDDIGTLLNHKTELSKSMERNMAMKPFFGNSVSSSEGERWKLIRKLMSPSFSFRTLEDKLKSVNEYSDRLIDVFDTNDDKSPVELYQYLRPYMFDILCSTLMGVESNFLANTDNAYLKASGQIIRIVTHNFFSYWRSIRLLFRMTPMYKEMMDNVTTIRQTSALIISQRKRILNEITEKTRENNKNAKINLETLIKNTQKKGDCLLDNFLTIMSTDEATDEITDEIINEEITLLCFTGHYTTTLSMSHTLYCLAKYPEVQDRVLQEQISIFNNDFYKKPTMHDLNEMKYLEAVIKESMRTIPTVTKIGRQLQNDLTFKDGRVAPAGTSVIVFYDALFKNPRIFAQPEKFKPERFLEPLHPYAFVPFSTGPRNCIGFKYAWVAMKATLTNMLRKYEVTPSSPGMEPQFVSRILTESKNGVHIILKKRDLTSMLK